MSPSKKKSAKTTTKKSAAKTKSTKSKKKAAPKKRAQPAKAASKKAAAKAKKPAKVSSQAGVKAKAKKAAVKTTAKKAAKAPAKAKKATSKKVEVKKEATKTAPKIATVTASPPKAKTPVTKKRAAGKAGKASKRARAKKTITPTGPRHPKLGYKWICFGCSAKFYDLGKEEPICPKCETNQRQRPPELAKPTVASPKPKVVRPMVQLLDDEEPAANAEEEGRTGNAAPAQNAMFDEAESDSAGLDIDDADPVDSAQEPPEIDAL